MTVYKTGKKKLEITLTDSEVISFFGAYESLAAITPDVKLTVGFILKESLSQYNIGLDGDLLVEIKAKKSSGCIITVSSADCRRCNEKKSYIFEFSDSDNLISGINALIKKNIRITDSSLYKMEKGYRLIVSSESNSDFFFINEFCRHQSNNLSEKEYTKEYGKLICNKNAVKKIGLAFKFNNC